MADFKDPRFELARKRAKQQVGAATQEQTGALKRRFASLGLGQSGAAIKAEQQALQRGAGAMERAEEGIQAQEFAEQARKREIQEGREFAAGQAQKQREFASGESALGRRAQELAQTRGIDAQKAMQLAQQEFASGEAKLGREEGAKQAQLDRDFQQGLADRTFELQKSAQDFSQTMAGKQFELALDQFDLTKIEAAANAVVQSLHEGFGGLTIGSRQLVPGQDLEALREERRDPEYQTVGVGGFGKGGKLSTVGSQSVQDQIAAAVQRALQEAEQKRQTQDRGR